MTKSILFALLAAAVATPAAAAERNFIITEYDRVQIEGPFEVTLLNRGANSAVARGSVQALDRVDIEVQGRLLKIRSKSSWGGNPNQDIGPVSIALTGHDVRAVQIRGSGSLSMDSAEGLRFDMALSGSGRLAVEKMDADTVNLALLGSGRILLAGKAKTLKAAVQGAGDLEASKLLSQDLDLNAGTSGAITVGAARTAKISALGSGDITILGSPACTVTRRGSGAVACGKSR